MKTGHSQDLRRTLQTFYSANYWPPSRSWPQSREVETTTTRIADQLLDERPLDVAWVYMPHADGAADLESEILRAYETQHGELPPLTRKIPTKPDLNGGELITAVGRAAWAGQDNTELRIWESRRCRQVIQRFEKKRKPHQKTRWLPRGGLVVFYNPKSMVNGFTTPEQAVAATVDSLVKRAARAIS